MWPFRRRSDEDFRGEIEAHVSTEADRLTAEGMTSDEARHAARRSFGNVTAAAERFHESRWVLWFDELRQDVRYALRALWRSPGFAAVAILTLALGIGSNTAIFSVVNAVMLRPIPYRDPSSLVLIDVSPMPGAPSWLTSAWRERARTLSDFAAFNGPRSATLVVRGEPEQTRSAFITWNFLSLLGVAPIAGRDFGEADASRGASPVALLSYALWISRFGGDPSIIGHTVRVSGNVVTVVGVTPPTFRFPATGTRTSVSLSLDTQPDVMRVAGPTTPLNVIGRLALGIAAPAATQELLALYKQAAASLLDDGKREYSQSEIDRLRLAAGPLQERLVGNVRERLWLTMGAVGFVLLVACANVANLLLARFDPSSGAGCSRGARGPHRAAGTAAADRERAAGAHRIGPWTSASRLHERRGADGARRASPAHRHDCDRLVGARVHDGGCGPHRPVVRPVVDPGRHAGQFDRRIQRRYSGRDRTEHDAAHLAVH